MEPHPAVRRRHERRQRVEPGDERPPADAAEALADERGGYVRAVERDRRPRPPARRRELRGRGERRCDRRAGEFPDGERRGQHVIAAVDLDRVRRSRVTAERAPRLAQHQGQHAEDYPMRLTR